MESATEQQGAGNDEVPVMGLDPAVEDVHAKLEDMASYIAAYAAEHSQQELGEEQDENSIPAQQQPHVHLMDGETWATPQQSEAAGDGRLKLLDVCAVADKFWSTMQPDRLSYVHHLAELAPVSKLARPDMGSRLPPNVQPSVLQQKLCSGANRLSSTLLPTLTADGLSFYDQPIAITSGQPQQQPHQPQLGQQPAAASSSNSNRVWQFNFSLLRANYVGPTGFKNQREPMYHVARVGIFDKARGRFLGNIHTVPATEVRARGLTWVWGPEGTSRTLAGSDKPRPDPIPPGELAGSPAARAAVIASVGLLGGLTEGLADHVSLGGSYAGAGGANSFIVRCAKEGLDPVAGLKLLDVEKISLYIELNVAFRLTSVDAAVVPEGEGKGAGVVSELTTCWALVSLKRCAELTREMDISVPLYTGSIYQPGLLAGVWEAHRKLHPLRSMFTATPTPQLTFRVGPIQATPPPLLPYNLMPSTFMARRSVAYLLAAARLALSQQLAAAAAAHGQQKAGSNAAAATAGVSMFAAVEGFSDAALAALPALLDDPLLLGEVMARWWGRCKGLVAAMEQQAQADCLLPGCSWVDNSIPPTRAQLVTALKTSLLEVSPLLHCSNMPADHMTNFVEHQQHRAQIAAKFLRHLDPKTSRQMSVTVGGGARHPVEVLNGLGGTILHKPFDVSEMRVCVADQVQALRWSRC